MQEVIGKVFFDQIALVATADYEIIDTMMGVGLHNVPKDWLATNFDHWLGLEVGFFGNTGSEATR